MAATLQLEPALIPTSTVFGLQARQQVTPSPTVNPVANHEYIYCFADTNSETRLLQLNNIAGTGNGPINCRNWCAGNDGSYNLCGVASGSECWCGLSTEYSASSVDSCTSPFNALTLNRYGGQSALDLYSVTVRPTPVAVDGYK